MKLWGYKLIVMRERMEEMLVSRLVLIVNVMRRLMIACVRL